jgi:uncharacterized protein DUF5715
MKAHPFISCCAVILLSLGLAGCRREARTEAVPSTTASPSDSAATAVPADSTVTAAATPAPSSLDLDSAIAQVEETRGSNGGIRTPSELRHYPDTRRFLSLQMADAQEAGITVPHDDAELIEMIRAGKLIRLAPLTQTYLLYEVGEDAKDDPLLHYDAAANKDVPLLPSMEAVEQRAAELEAGGAAGRAQKAVLDAYYGAPARRDPLFREYQAVASFASENGYDLADRDERTRMHKDLLSYIRPEARDVLVKLAEAYHRQFGRLLPVTSVVRTERYQRRLGGVNPNATRVDLPPHGTGEAFDISYRYMASDEQNFVMDQIAQLEDEQKVEALRENRGHIHVYAFAGGDRPPEPMVEAARAMVDAARAERAEEGRAYTAKVKATKKARAAKATVKRTSSRTGVRAQRKH